MLFDNALNLVRLNFIFNHFFQTFFPFVHLPFYIDDRAAVLHDPFFPYKKKIH